MGVIQKDSQKNEAKIYRSSNNTYSKQNKEFLVIFSHTVIDPGAVVIHLSNTSLTYTEISDPHSHLLAITISVELRDMPTNYVPLHKLYLEISPLGKPEQ